MKRFAAILLALTAVWGIPHTAVAASGPECVKNVDVTTGTAWSKCYNIEPYMKQRLRVRLFDYATDTEVVRRGPWITYNKGESIVLWNVYRYLFLSARVVVVYA